MTAPSKPLPLPCPVCGGTPNLAEGYAYPFRVVCEASPPCLSGPVFESEAEAISAWNRLAALPRLVEALERCRKHARRYLDGDTSAGIAGTEIEQDCDAALALAKGESDG